MSLEHLAGVDLADLLSASIKHSANMTGEQLAAELQWQAEIIAARANYYRAVQTATEHFAR